MSIIPDHTDRPFTPSCRTWFTKVLRSPLFWIMLVSLVFRCLYVSRHNEIVTTPDTKSYVSKQLVENLWKGQVDTIRTPVYPCFIDAIRSIFGEEKLLKRITVIQRIISFASIACFYWILSNVLKSRVLVILGSLYYGVFRLFCSYNMTILTESLSISCTVFLLGLTLLYVKRPNHAKAVVLGLLPFLFIMLRPSFVFLIPIFLLFFTFRMITDKQSRPIETVGLFSVIFSLSLVFGYCHLVYRASGHFTPTTISYLNQYEIILDSTLYKNGSDPVINDLIQKHIDEYKIKYPEEIAPETLAFTFRSGLSLPGHWNVRKEMIPEWFNLEKIKSGEYFDWINYSKETLRKNRWEFIQYNIGKFIEIGRYYNIDTKWMDPGRTILFRFGFVYCVLLIDLIALFYIAVFFRRISWFSWVTLFFVAGIVFTAIVGAQGDWSRLCVAALPPLFIIYGKYLDMAFLACENMLRVKV